VATFDSEIDLLQLRTRTSEKWAKYPEQILPLFVAETDFPLAAEIADALHRAIDRGDTGYAVPSGLGKAYSDFSVKRYGYRVNPEYVFAVPEVMVGVAEVLRVLAKPGDRVVINPPVYPPFFATLDEVALPIEEVPLKQEGDSYELDFDGLERALADGVRFVLLCNPHNPVGRVYSRDDVFAIARLAKQYDAIVFADEIHAPLVLPGAEHTPFDIAASEIGVRAISFTSASKGWNIAGLKCALAIASSEWGVETLKKLPEEMPERVGHFGVIATIAAFRDAVPYLDHVVRHLDEQRIALRLLLDEYGFERIRYAPPQASFLAWLDCNELGLGANPALQFFKGGDVALYPGLKFGSQGAGFVRFNFGTSTEIIREALTRMKAAASQYA
jgi:cystathionine beta-lyase